MWNETCVFMKSVMPEHLLTSEILWKAISYINASYLPALLFILVVTRKSILFLYRGLFNKKESDQEKSEPLESLQDCLKIGSRFGDLLQVYPNGWIPIYKSRDLKKGKSVSISVVGHDLALFRGMDGQAYVVDAYCPHLGANLAVGSRIKDGNCIECPFHGWRFNGSDGKCTFIPEETNIPVEAKLQTWNVTEEFGTIFIWHHIENESPSWYIERMEEITNGKYTEKFSSNHSAFCHVKDVLENTADASHYRILHALFLPKDNFDHTESGLLSHFKLKHQHPISETKGPWACYSINTQLEVFGMSLPLLRTTFKVIHVGPAFAYMRLQHPFSEVITTIAITPEGPLKQRVCITLYGDWKVPRFVFYTTFHANRVHFEREVIVWNHRKYNKRPILIKEDKLMSEFNRWYSQFFSPSSPTFRDIIRSSFDW